MTSQHPGQDIDTALGAARIRMDAQGAIIDVTRGKVDALVVNVVDHDTALAEVRRVSAANGTELVALTEAVARAEGSVEVALVTAARAGAIATNLDTRLTTAEGRLANADAWVASLDMRLSQLAKLHPELPGTPAPVPEDRVLGTLMISGSPNRSGAVPLADAALITGDVYLFFEPAPGEAVTHVVFYLGDDVLKEESAAPFDAAGTDGGGAARPFNTRAMANGTYTFSAYAETADEDYLTNDIEVELYNVPATPPTIPATWDKREPIVLNGGEGTVYSGIRVEMRNGGDWAVLVKNSAGVTVQDSQCFGGGIQFQGGSDGTVRHSLVSRDVAGSPGASDGESGVRFLGHVGGRLLDSVVAYGDSCIRVEASEHTELRGNFTYNPRGPKWRGQHIQSWTYNGQVSRDIVIADHYGLTDWLRPGEFGLFQEDAVNLGQVLGVRIENTLMEMRGLSEHVAQGGSPSGSGLMFESSKGIVIRGFTSIGQANLGIGVYSGSVVDLMENVLSIVDRNPLANQALTVDGSTVTFGAGVRLFGIKPNGDPYGSIWTNNATLYGREKVLVGVSGTAASNAERAAVVPPISIPDVGWVFPPTVGA